MKFVELAVLLPCHSLEDFPTHHEGTEADGLLSAWSALWHPTLLTTVGKLPTWYRADDPPPELADKLLVVPHVSENLLLAGWTQRAASEGAHLVRQVTGRDEIVTAALAALDEAPPAVDADLAADFLALGTCYLQVELLTRQMRYTSNIDDVHLRNETLAAAEAAAAGRADEARTHLGRCFDVLTEARHRFYPVESYFLDLVLTVPNSNGAALRSELNSNIPKNLLLSGETLDTLAAEQPDTLAALRTALAQKTATIVGGEYRERELPLLPLESILAGFRQGHDAYQRHLDVRPKVFGRRRYGLTPLLPQILEKLGYLGALHFTLDDGAFPEGAQAKIRWEGIDASAIDALARVPLDAARTETFLSLPQRISHSMDTDHVSTVLLAHWPGHTSPFYEDLRRMAHYGPVLGRFVTLDYYFEYTDRPGELTRLRPDRYRAPYLRQAIVRQQPDALSRHVRHVTRSTQAHTARALTCFADLTTGTPTPSPAESPMTLDRESLLDDAPLAGPIDEQLAAAQLTAARRLAAAVAGTTRPATGVFVANAESFARRVTVDVSTLPTPPDVAGPVVAVQSGDGRTHALVDVPGAGFAWLRAGTASPPTGKPPRPLAEENVLRNEFCEIRVHPETGGLQSIHTFNYRGNRLSQQLAYRLPNPRPQPGDVWRDPDLEPNYSIMICDGLTVTATGPAWGEIVSRGRLVTPDHKPLAEFTQTFRLERSSRVLVIDIDLTVLEVPRADPWNSYFAARFAWGDSSAELCRSLGGTSQPTSAKRLEAPQFIEIREVDRRLAVLTGGLPYHRYNTLRMLDTLLVVRGESQHRFRLGIAIDSPHPALDATHLQAPPVVVADAPLPTEPHGAGWLFHLDARNLLATDWQPLVEQDRVIGFRVRLLETEGRAGRVRLRALRRLSAARQVDFDGATLVELQIDDDAVPFDVGAYEWVEIEARF